jgi:type VI secretion system protein ImpK
MRASFASLMEQVADAVKFFETDIRSAGISEQQANTAKYILCATADDIVQHIPTEDRHVWTQYSMLSRFFGERVGGVRFFEILDRLKADPLVNYPVLELQHACLALGFQGMHRTTAGGLANLQLIQRNLYETLRRVRPKVMSDLSPNWRGQALANRQQRIRVPVWMVAAVVAALLAGGYFILRELLSGRAENAAEVAMALHPSDPIELKRRVISPPPPAPPPPVDRLTQLQRIRNALAAEKTECAMTADQTPSFIVIRVCDLILFSSAQATVLEAFKPVAGRIAATLDKEPGRIKIVGHTDSSPMKSVRFPQARIDRFSAGRNRRQGTGRADRQQYDSGRTRQKPAGRDFHRAQRIAVEIGRRPKSGHEQDASEANYPHGSVWSRAWLGSRRRLFGRAVHCLWRVAPA